MKLYSYVHQQSARHIFKLVIDDEELARLNITSDNDKKLWDWINTDDFSVPATVRLAALMLFVARMEQLDIEPKV